MSYRNEGNERKDGIESAPILLRLDQLCLRLKGARQAERRLLWRRTSFLLSLFYQRTRMILTAKQRGVTDSTVLQFRTSRDIPNHTTYNPQLRVLRITDRVINFILPHPMTQAHLQAQARRSSSPSPLSSPTDPADPSHVWRQLTLRQPVLSLTRSIDINRKSLVLLR